ncbi:hypothetical protein ACFSGX_16770 [Sphingomonas arantia]|uniref:Uncharacterized protein n=1 Tax=Sphingomonas arantia TaxID=1460676 RepID=A0ABW4U262_9SPHN
MTTTQGISPGLHVPETSLATIFAGRSEPLHHLIVDRIVQRAVPGRPDAPRLFGASPAAGMPS